jgi:hypothetical protein
MKEAKYNLGRLLPVAEGGQEARPYPARLGFRVRTGVAGGRKAAGT